MVRLLFTQGVTMGIRAIHRSNTITFWGEGYDRLEQLLKLSR